MNVDETVSFTGHSAVATDRLNRSFLELQTVHMERAVAGPPVRPNLLLGQPMPVAPNLIWVSDITYLPLVNGEWAYLGAWMDLFSRRIVGWMRRWKTA